MKKSILSIGLVWGSMVCQAQERVDSLKLDRDTIGGLSDPNIEELRKVISPEEFHALDAATMSLDASGTKDLDFNLPPMGQPINMNLYLPPVIQNGDYLPRWNTGYMYGRSQMMSSLLYGYVASAMAGVHQNIGDKLSVDFTTSLNKYSVYNNTAVFGTMFNWRPSNYFELSAFANYMPGSFFSSIQIGPSYQWGGYATFQTDTSIPLGIDIGVRGSHDPMTGNYVAPIIQPFVKFRGAKLSIDFGPKFHN